MIKLEFLEIIQNVETKPLPITLGQIPSLNLSKINIKTDSITLNAVEGLLAQINDLKAESTYVNLRTDELKDVSIKIFVNINKLINNKL